MIPQQEMNILSQFSQRAAAILKTEGIGGLAKRTRGRLGRQAVHHTRCIVSIPLAPLGSLSWPRPEFEIKRLPPTDDHELEALTGFGEAALSKTQILQRLAEGQLCYVATSGGQMASCLWIVSGEFRHDYLQRTIQLAQDQVYGRGAFTAPAFRGKRLMAYLARQAAHDILREGKKRSFGFIAPSNTPSLRGVAKLGAQRIGRIGFVEILGIRFYYLFGREALTQTKQRFNVTRM